MPAPRPLVGVGLMFGLAALAGCGGEPARPGPEKQATAPAGGTVKLRGAPLAGASVRFQAVDGKVSAYGTTDAAGKFTLSTYGKDDGAPAGKYKVTVAVSGVKEISPGVLDPNFDPSKSPVPADYGNPETTPLTAEVKPGGDNQFPFDVK